MGGRQYRVVFNGDFALDTEESQVREKLASQCKCSSERIDNILSGRNPVLKKGLDKKTAQRYKVFLENIGLLCDLVAESPPKPANLQSESSSGNDQLFSQNTQPEGQVCPKCFTKDQVGDSCQRCGILFSRYEEIQARRAKGHYEQPQESSDDESYFNRHPEQFFVLKVVSLILLILLLQGFLNNLISIVILLFPVVFLVYIRMQAAVNDQSPTELLAEHITFMPVMYSKEERAQEYVPRVTYGLIVSNILIFYLFEFRVNPELIYNNLIFLPYKPNLLNVPLSAFTSLFLHAGNAHLWGNMLFLWACGTVVERRIGSFRFISFYLVAGVAANITYLFACKVAGTPAHILGASGAIAGVMGVFAIRCYFKSMVFPLPILGIFSLILPVSLKVRLNSLVIIGLFFLADLSGGIQQLAGTNSSNIGHWAHLGGMICGIALASFFKLNEDAINERHIEIGSSAVNAKIGSGSKAGEESLRMLLKKNPEDMDALLLLARLRSKHTATEEADQLYQKVLPLLVRHRPEEAMIAFYDYFKLYMKGCDTSTMYQLANIFHRQKDFEMSSRCLEMVCKDTATPGQILEKALFQLARTLDMMGLAEPAEHYYRKLVESFPDSSLKIKVGMRLKSLNS